MTPSISRSHDDAIEHKPARRGGRPLRRRRRPCAQRGDGGGGEAAHRLDKRTYLAPEQGRFRIIARDYGDGLCEIGWSFAGVAKVAKAGRGLSGQRKANEDRATRRARSRLRQLILTAQADHLLTLTYRANVTDYAQATHDLARFVRAVRGDLPGWVYVAVPERQKRGAWHWHLAVRGRQDVALLRSCWRGVVGDGNIDVQPPRRKSGDLRLGIVRYMGKYLSKGFESGDRALNGHRYRASLGIRIPAESLTLPEPYKSNAPRFVLEQLHARVGSIGYWWLDPRGLAGWACSWR